MPALRHYFGVVDVAAEPPEDLEVFLEALSDLPPIGGFYLYELKDG